MIESPLCTFCQKDDESLEHFLFHCNIIKIIIIIIIIIIINMGTGVGQVGALAYYGNMNAPAHQSPG